MQLDVFVKRKKLEQNKGFFDHEGKAPDRRRFKVEMTPEESLEKSIMSDIEIFGLAEPSRLLTIIKKVPHYQTLNIRLLSIVYFYFSEKNFDFGLVVNDFDKDFEEEVKKIYEKGYFPKLDGRKFTALEKHKFRQDFIIYMILISEMETTETVEIATLTEETSHFTNETFDTYDTIGE